MAHNNPLQIHYNELMSRGAVNLIPIAIFTISSAVRKLFWACESLNAYFLQ